MKTDEQLTDEQRALRLVISCASGISILSIIDIYGFSASKQLGFSHELLSLLSLFVIISFTFISSKYISRKAAIWTGIVLGFFESAIGQMWFIESSNGELKDPWPPVYLIAIIFYTAFFYGIARLINYFLYKEKTNQAEM